MFLQHVKERSLHLHTFMRPEWKRSTAEERKRGEIVQKFIVIVKIKELKNGLLDVNQ